MHRINYKFILLLIIPLTYASLSNAAPSGKDQPTCVLYDQKLNDTALYPDILLGKTQAEYTSQGLLVKASDDVIKLNRYYSLAERCVRYHVKFRGESRAVFRSDLATFKAFVDFTSKTISIESNPRSEKYVSFMNPENEYIVEIYQSYMTAKLRIIDLFTGQEEELSVTKNGSGGCGAGAVFKGDPGVSFGQQYDYYCFGLETGSSMLVKQITVLSEECDLTLLLYGDSITEPEGYFPRDDFSDSWTQLIITNVKGKAMASGRGGTTINEVLERIKNELPYLKAKYVMVTIGTNGSNTEENLSELVEYIISQGSVPILNNIPSNESGTQVLINSVIDKVRIKYGIKGCKFDLATSVDFDGMLVDISTMWHEDYEWGDIYHHPNVKGSRLMFLRTLLDTPEIYE